MLTDVEIEAGDIRRLKPTAQLALRGLVRRSQAASRAGGYYSDVLTVIQAACAAAFVPEVIAQNLPSAAAADEAALILGATPEDLALCKALAAVCAKLAALPPVMVLSEGTDKNRRRFSTDENLEELAQDVINVLYDTPPLMAGMFAVATRKICDDYVALGVRYRSMDELIFSARGAITVPPFYR
jgi:hypothetical protein